MNLSNRIVIPPYLTFTINRKFNPLFNGKMITKTEFDNIQPGTIFAKGETTNDPEGIYMTDSKLHDKLKWLAKKGYNNDWVIYCYWDLANWDFIATNGQKVADKANIIKLVPCDEQTLNSYRF